MTLVTESRSPDNPDDNTVIRPDLSSLRPPSLGDAISFDADNVTSDPAEAPTIIVSRADPRHVERTPPRVSEPKAEPPKSRFAIRIGTHPPISLEVPAYIGRKPSTPRISGPQMPRLVMVPSPAKEVSSTHVEILQEADNVVVTDLGSTNGTKVTMAGFAPRTLRQGESLVVGLDAVVDIGDGIRIVIVALPEVIPTEGTL